MTTPLTALAAKPVPAFCTSGHGILTPAQWKTCWDAGWSQPVTGAAHAGAATGHYAAPGIALALAIIAVLFIASKLGSSSAPAASKN